MRLSFFYCEREGEKYLKWYKEENKILIKWKEEKKKQEVKEDPIKAAKGEDKKWQWLKFPS